MTAGNIICFILYLLTALLMAGIGLSQYRSQKPVGFYSGEQPPKESELTDVLSWNRKHGRMWMAYGMIIILSYFAGALIGDSIWCLLPMCGGTMVPVIFMIRYHNKLKKKYLRK